MKLNYIIATILGLAGCIVYYFQTSFQKKLEDYIFIFLTSAGIIGGIKTARIGLYGKELKNVSNDTRFYIFIGGAVIFLVSIYAGARIFHIDIGLF